jgi:hypothetical protein
MAYTPNQRRTNQVAAAYGYRTSVMENTVAVGEFEVGQGAIILTKKGEPIMSGPIDEIREPVEEYDEEGAIQIGGRWFAARDYSFRRV